MVKLIKIEVSRMGTLKKYYSKKRKGKKKSELKDPIKKWKAINNRKEWQKYKREKSKENKI